MRSLKTCNLWNEAPSMDDGININGWHQIGVEETSMVALKC